MVTNPLLIGIYRSSLYYYNSDDGLSDEKKQTDRLYIFKKKDTDKTKPSMTLTVYAQTKKMDKSGLSVTWTPGKSGLILTVLKSSHTAPLFHCPQYRLQNSFVCLFSSPRNDSIIMSAFIILLNNTSSVPGTFDKSTDSLYAVTPTILPDMSPFETASR